MDTPIEKMLDLVPHQLRIGDKRYTFGMNKSEYGYEVFYQNVMDDEDFLILYRRDNFFRALIGICSWLCANRHIQKPKRAELLIFEAVPDNKVRAAEFEAGKSEWNV